MNSFLINNSTKLFNGYIYSASVNFNYESPSEVTVSLVCEGDSEFTITKEDLSTEEVYVIKLPFQASVSPFVSTHKSIEALLVSFNKREQNGEKLLDLNFVDKSLIYLDKHLVLLNYKHILTDAPRVLRVGRAYKANDAGVNQLIPSITPPASSGPFLSSNPDPTAEVYYNSKDLGDSIINAGIPISPAFYEFLVAFQDVTENDVFGTLREVLNTWGGELGFIPYWDFFYGQSGFGTQQESGRLDFILLKDLDSSLSTEEIQSLIQDVKDNNCCIGSVNETLDISDNQSVGNLVYAENQTSSAIQSTGVEELEAYNIESLRWIRNNFTRDTITPYTRKDLERLVKAAALGPEFYQNYVLQCLLYRGAYLTPLNDLPPSPDEGRVDNEEDEDNSRFKWEGGNTTEFDQKYTEEEYRNLLVERLYNFTSASDFLKIQPIQTFVDKVTYSAKSGGEAESSFEENLKKLIKLHAPELIKKKEINFAIGLLEAEKTEEILLDGKTKRQDTYQYILRDVEKDPVYRLARIYYLYQEKLFYKRAALKLEEHQKRNYEQGVNAIYAGLAISETQFADIFDTLTQGLEDPKFISEEQDWPISTRGEASGNNPKETENYLEDRKTNNETFNIDGYKNINNVWQFFVKKSGWKGGAKDGGYLGLQEYREKNNKEDRIDDDYQFIYLLKETKQHAQQKGLSLNVTPVDDIRNAFFSAAESDRRSVFVIEWVKDINSYLDDFPISVGSSNPNNMYVSYTRLSSSDDSQDIITSTLLPQLTNDKVAKIQFNVNTISQPEGFRRGQIPEEYLEEDKTQYITNALQLMNIARSYTDDEAGFSASLSLSDFPASNPGYPTIKQGLESLSIVFGNGVQVSMNLGQSRRKRAAAELVARHLASNLWINGRQGGSPLKNTSFLSRFAFAKVRK